MEGEKETEGESQREGDQERENERKECLIEEIIVATVNILQKCKKCCKSLPIIMHSFNIHLYEFFLSLSSDQFL